MKSNCITCGKQTDLKEIALSKKFLGRGTQEIFCLECMAKEFYVEVEWLNKKAEEFKKNGCILFEFV